MTTEISKYKYEVTPNEAWVLRTAVAIALGALEDTDKGAAGTSLAGRYGLRAEDIRTMETMKIFMDSQK